ncbi:hypothetical protein EVAR_69290_1, partial [Eumeta japonica]
FFRVCAFVYDGQNGLAYFNKDERPVKMILARSCDGTRGSRTEATWEVIARVLFYKTICPHAGFEAGPAGFSEIDHPPTAQI